MLRLLSKGTGLEMQLSRVLDLQSVKMQTHPATSRGRLGSALLCFGGEGWKRFAKVLVIGRLRPTRRKQLGVWTGPGSYIQSRRCWATFFSFAFSIPSSAVELRICVSLADAPRRNSSSLIPTPPLPHFICVYVVYFYVCAPVCTRVCTPRCWR